MNPAIGANRGRNSHTKNPKKKPMIYEMRIYTLQLGKLRHLHVRIDS